LSAGIAALYLDAQRSFIEFVHDLTDDHWATPVPCCPGWTVRDVLSHVSGIPDDAVAGRLDGVTTPEWTASQVERNREVPVDDLIERWNAQAPQFAAAIDAGGELRPPFDCHSHEHDIRHAVRRPANREDALVQEFGRQLIESLTGPFSLDVEFPTGPVRAGGRSPAGHSVTLSGVTEFEVFRSRLGRRSRRQVEAYAWSGQPAQVALVLDGWFAFGPSIVDIDET
jgi:uncharacterized protein (TIGR03083 family)